MLEVRIRKTLPGFKLEATFSIDHEILAILGPSGSGKTMTLQCIAGLMQPDEGYVRLNGRLLLDSASSFSLTPQLRRVGFVFQNYALFPHLTVYDNIAFGICHLTRQEIAERVDQLIRKMNLQELGHRYPKQLSAGQQQRVALARALAPEPDLLLLDEPFSALDAQVKERLGNELLEIQQYYKGDVLFVTHDLAEAYKLCSKIAVYESGHILQFDSKQGVIEGPACPAVASLTGVRNLLEGVVANLKETNVWVAVPGLSEPLRINLKNGVALKQNQNVTVGIRPEYIYIADNPGENTFLSTVDRAIEGVATINYCFCLQGSGAANKHYLEANLLKQKTPWLPSGQKCYLHLPPERLFIMTKSFYGARLPV